MKRTLHWKTARRWKTSGQALILIVGTFFLLMFFLGLMVDLGQIFLAKGYLRRAADSAALAAAAQFRKATDNQTETDTNMINAADEASKLNGVTPTSITVETCNSTKTTNPPDGDSVLCAKLYGMPQKLVRVSIFLRYPLSFMQLFGIDHVDLTETSISEAASMDVVLVIDTSESMAWDLRGRSTAPGADPTDPSYCNTNALPNPDVCEPFNDVKTAAETFAGDVLNLSSGLEEDRLAIVPFATGWQDGTKGTYVANGTDANYGWTTDKAVANSVIGGLTVYNPDYQFVEDGSQDYSQVYPGNPFPLGPIRLYDDANKDNYLRMNCLSTHVDKNGQDGANRPEAISTCGTTNIGGALYLAGLQFAKDQRPNALWVVVLLTDGAADATFGNYWNQNGGLSTKIWAQSMPQSDFESRLPLGYCPDNNGSWDTSAHHICQDGIAANYHSPTSGKYDANDYAMDQANYVACPTMPANPATSCGATKGQGAIIFTIGMGSEINRMDTTGTKPYGGTLLRYLASVGDDGNPDNPDGCTPAPMNTTWTMSCGNYFYAPSGDQLQSIFEKIYSRIFTRLTQ